MKPFRPTAAALVLLCLACEGGDPAGSEPLVLRVDGVEETITCPVFFQEEAVYTMAFYWVNGIFTITVSMDHVLRTRIDPPLMDAVGLRVVEPSLSRSRPLEVAGSVIWLQSVLSTPGGADYIGNAEGIRARFEGYDGEEILVELNGTFGLKPPPKVDLNYCLDAAGS